MNVMAQFHESLEDPETRGLVLSYLGQVPFFHALKTDQLLALAAASRCISFEPSELIFRQGDEGTDLHIIIEGSVRMVQRADEEGHAKLVATRARGDAFGEIGFLAHSPRALTAQNGPEAGLHLVLKRSDFDTLVAGEPTIGVGVFTELFDTLMRRMEYVPPFFRNYVFWGYRARPTEQSATLEGEPWLSKTKAFALGGLLWGAAGSALMFWLNAQIASPYQRTIPHSTYTMAFAAAGLVAGVILGAVTEHVEEGLRFRRRSPRSCGNCKFAVWRDGLDKPECFFKNSQMATIAIRPGRRFDTYTNCPSFELAPRDERVRMRQEVVAHG